EAQSHHHRLMPAHGRRRHFCSDRRIHYLRNSIPRIVVARLPEPSEAGNEGPVAIIVGHPAPGITRDPHVAGTWIEGPAAVLERAPVGADEVGLPDGAVAGHVHEAAVIIQVAHAVTIRRRNARAAGGSV